MSAEAPTTWLVVAHEADSNCILTTDEGNLVSTRAHEPAYFKDILQWFEKESGLAIEPVQAQLFKFGSSLVVLSDSFSGSQVLKANLRWREPRSLNAQTNLLVSGIISLIEQPQRKIN